jgi:hypothetical protein
LSAYTRFNLDGIDIDWEYPNGTGAGNEKSSNDSANFLKFLKLLRNQLPVEARITAATQDFPFAGKDGQPLSDVSDFAGVLDWILVMNYDVWGCEYTFYIDVLVLWLTRLVEMTLQPRLHLVRTRHFLMDAVTQANLSPVQSRQFDHGQMLAFQQGRFFLGFRHTVM